MLQRGNKYTSPPRTAGRSTFLEKTLAPWTGAPGRVRTMTEAKKKGGGILDKLIGNEGVKFDINLTPETNKTLLLTASILGGGMAADGFFRYLATRK